jgi:hypothetical protein
VAWSVRQAAVGSVALDNHQRGWGVLYRDPADLLPTMMAAALSPNLQIAIHAAECFDELLDGHGSILQAGRLGSRGDVDQASCSHTTDTATRPPTRPA